jgi:hypothetical protein
MGNMYRTDGRETLVHQCIGLLELAIAVCITDDSLTNLLLQ